MILGFTGTEQGMTQAQRATVRYLFNELQLTELHHGDCIGADAQAHTDSIKHGAEIVIHPPSDSKKRAFCDYSLPNSIRLAKPYMERNFDIANEGVDGLIAAPNGPHEILRSGTWSTVRRARKLKRRIWIVRPDGTFREEQL